jgi:hypothetical protein
MALCLKSARLLAVALVLLALLPGGARAAERAPGAGPARAGALIPFDWLPGLLAPVSLLLPWQCGDCAPGVEQVNPRPVPDLNPYDFGSVLPWLVAQFYNNIAYPLICWLLAIGQAVLNLASFVLNNTIIAGINFAWRLALYSLLWGREVFLAAWGGWEWLRLQTWLAWGWMLQRGLDVLGLFDMLRALLQLAGDMLNQLAGLLLAAGQALAYFVALLVALLPAFVAAVFNPEMPPQLAAINNFWLVVMLRDTLNAIADSKIGWSWFAFIALFYAKFISWLLDEASQVNS